MTSGMRLFVAGWLLRSALARDPQDPWDRLMTGACLLLGVLMLWAGLTI